MQFHVKCPRTFYLNWIRALYKFRYNNNNNVHGGSDVKQSPMALMGGGQNSGIKKKCTDRSQLSTFSYL